MVLQKFLKESLKVKGVLPENWKGMEQNISMYIDIIKTLSKKNLKKKRFLEGSSRGPEVPNRSRLLKGGLIKMFFESESRKIWNFIIYLKKTVNLETLKVLWCIQGSESI